MLRGWSLIGLALVSCLAGCSRQGSGPSRTAGVSVEGTRLAAPPIPAELPGLDPAAVELVRGAAADLERDIDRPELWTQLGMVLHAHQLFEPARSCYEQRLLRDLDDARTWYFLALIEEELGSTGRAIERFEQSIRLDPGYPPAHWRMGYLLLGQGELELARAAMQAALAIAPHDAAAVVGLARVHLQQGENEPAIVLLEQHLERVPRDSNARFLLGTAYRAAGRPEEAARQLGGSPGADPIREDPWEGEVLSLRKGYRTDFLRAVDLLGKGKIEESIALFESLHRRQPQDTLIHINLHRAYRVHGELGRAIELLVEAREIDPLQDVIHLHLAGAYRDQALQAGDVPDDGLLQQALASAERACELSPTYAAAHGLRADILLDLRRIEESTSAYVQAAGLDTNSAMWQQKAAQALCQAGRWGEAVPLLQRLDVLQPRSARVLLYLAAALANSGHIAEARIPLEQARSIAPTDPTILKAIDAFERNAPAASPVPVPAEQDSG